MVITTKVSYAKRGTISLKSTIPEAIAEFMGLSEGDTLQWIMAPAGNGERRVIVLMIKGAKKK